MESIPLNTKADWLRFLEPFADNIKIRLAHDEAGLVVVAAEYRVAGVWETGESKRELTNGEGVVILW